MTLADDVAELEENYDNLKSEVRVLEESLDEVEGELEEVTNERNKLQEFYDWVLLAYPVVVKDYESVKVIEEMANGI
jgi:predicted nuclease with TOPRIM domain